ncbi:MAG TPA: hypothetical protein VES20_14000 [Bryobacteraceae bacterium]|nr:hypothetical protein [Bryobacteraceae bacterium]
MPTAALLTATAAEIAAYVFLAVQLFRHHLAGTYRWLCCFALADALRLVIGSAIPRRTDLYAWFYLTTQPITWLLLALVTLEIYSGVLHKHAGLAGLSRKAMAGVLGAATILAVLTLPLNASSDGRMRHLESFFLLERTVYFSLLAFVIFLACFLAWYPIRLAQNTLVHFGVFTGYFGTLVAAWFVRTLGGPAFVHAANVLHMTGTIAAACLWAILLRTDGERVSSKAGVRNRTPDEEERILAQLEAINRTLLRSDQRH